MRVFLTCRDKEHPDLVEGNLKVHENLLKNNCGSVSWKSFEHVMFRSTRFLNRECLRTRKAVLRSVQSGSVGGIFLIKIITDSIFAVG